MPRARVRAIRRSIGSAGLVLVLSAAALSPACSSQDTASPEPSSLVVERTTEGDVTTVRNVSGSTWGGRAHLAEELSIGVLEGDEAYMFGRIGGLWVTDESVYVVDSQAPTIRVYDLQGNHLRDIGGEGQGPGEFQRPGQVVVLEDGTVAVDDNGNRRIVFFDAEGQPSRSWRPEVGYIFGLDRLADGSLLVDLGMPPQERESGTPSVKLDEGVSTLSDDDELSPFRPVPDFGFKQEPITVQSGDMIAIMSGTFLFRPVRLWTIRPDGAIVAGVSDRYRFEIGATDGARTVVEKTSEPVPVSAEEAAYAVARAEGDFARMVPGWRYEGDPPSSTQPAYDSLTADRDGRIWVVRRLASESVPDCVEDPHDDPDGADEQPCWKLRTTVDVFAPDGTYLGEVIRPEGLEFHGVFIRGDEYWAAVEDEDGLLTVKRFRIVTPTTT